MPTKSALNIGVVCGEHSGDRLGAGLIKEIKKNSDINLYGIGGPKLEELGFKSEFDFSEINIMGLVQPLINYRKLSKLRRSLIKLFIEKEIDLFIGIDSPDFNIGIHKALKNNHDNRNIQVVSPSVWGWRQNRVKPINKYIDLIKTETDLDNKKIKPFTMEFKYYLDILTKFSEWINDKMKTNKDDVSAAANDYLKTLGFVSVAYAWIKVLNISFKDYDENKNFYDDKINTAKFYFDKVLPRAEQHYKSAISGS